MHPFFRNIQVFHNKRTMHIPFLYILSLATFKYLTINALHFPIHSFFRNIKILNIKLTNHCSYTLSVTTIKYFIINSLCMVLFIPSASPRIECSQREIRIIYKFFLVGSLSVATNTRERWTYCV